AGGLGHGPVDAVFADAPAVLGKQPGGARAGGAGGGPLLGGGAGVGGGGGGPGGGAAGRRGVEPGRGAGPHHGGRGHVEETRPWAGRCGPGTPRPGGRTGRRRPGRPAAAW